MNTTQRTQAHLLHTLLNASEGWAAGDDVQLANELDALTDLGWAERIPGSSDSRMGPAWRITPAGRTAATQPAVRPFTVSTSKGPFATVFTDSAEKACAYARLLTGEQHASVYDLTALPEGAELIYAGRSNEKYRRREWLVRYKGIEVHVFEEMDGDGWIRFRASTPGYGGAGHSIEYAIDGKYSFEKRLHEGLNPTWFTDSVRAGKAYFPTSYVPPKETP